MLSLNPTGIFQSTQKESAIYHQAAVRSSALAVRLTFALAAMAGKPSVTSENLVGARIFIDTFLNLAEKPELPKPPVPNKDLGQKVAKKETEK